MFRPIPNNDEPKKFFVEYNGFDVNDFKNKKHPFHKYQNKVLIKQRFYSTNFIISINLN